MPAPSTEPGLRTVTFASEQVDSWGAVWQAVPRTPALLIVTSGERTVAETASVRAGHEHASWQVEGASARLLVEPVGDAVRLGPRSEGAALVAEQGAFGFEQLCRVRAEISGTDGDGAIEASGRRGERRADSPLERYESVREVSAWFDLEEAATLTALRPRKHRGQEDDVLSAAVIDSEGFPPITDPRLSTTYSAAGSPLRTGLELWSADPERHPWRLAGESAAHPAELRDQGWQLTVQLLRCHSRGRDGAGIYLLAWPA